VSDETPSQEIPKKEASKQAKKSERISTNAASEEPPEGFSNNPFAGLDLDGDK